MPLYRLQVAVASDTPFPRDRIVNSLHFQDNGALSNPENLCQDLLDAYQAGWLSVQAREIRVSAYEVPGTGPPVATKVENLGLAPAISMAREQAICLSYFAGENRPRRRGRIYLCVGLRASFTTVRPSTTLMNDALAMGPRFAGLGGADVDWVLYSPTESAHFKVTNTWVDDEWDTIRSRGLAPTTRVTAAPGS